MPVSVILDFLPMRGYTKLHIFEAATRATAPGTQIELVTVDPNNPPTQYTTALATSQASWFSIQWEDAKGGLSPMSDPVQGGTYSLVSKIVQRVLLRDSSLDETVVTQTAEWIISRVMRVTDPYSVAPSLATLDQIEGMTLLTLARSHVSTVIAASTGESYSAGMVSQRAASSPANVQDTIKYLIEEANRLLHYNFSVIMLLEDIDVTNTGNRSAISYDHSRLLLDVE